MPTIKSSIARKMSSFLESKAVNFTGCFFCTVGLQEPQLGLKNTSHVYPSFFLLLNYIIWCMAGFVLALHNPDRLQ